MSPEEARRALERLRALLEGRGLAWLVRRTEEEFERGARADEPDDDDLQRLVLLVDAAIDVFELTTELRREIPGLLLRATEATAVVLLRPDARTADLPQATRVTAPDPRERQRVDALVGALRELRRSVYEAL